MMSKTPTDTPQQPGAHLLAGAIAGTVSKVVVFPLDLAKTRMQSTSFTFTSIYSTLRHVMHSKSTVRVLYTGLGPNLIGEAVSWGLYFSFYDLGKRELRTSRDKLTRLQLLGCSLFAGISTQLLTNPIWVVKTRVQANLHKYHGGWHCFQTMLKQEGFTSFYRGIIPGLALVSNGAVNFVLYEELRAIVSKQKGELKSRDFLLMGALSKTLSSFVTYPLQVIRTRHYCSMDTVDVSYRSIIGIYRSEGLRAFYRGLSAHFLKTLPASALTFFTFENAIKVFNSQWIL